MLDGYLRAVLAQFKQGPGGDDPRYEIWLASGTHSCPACQELNGEVFAEGEGPQPPLHPHCGCTRSTYSGPVPPADKALVRLDGYRRRLLAEQFGIATKDGSGFSAGGGLGGSAAAGGSTGTGGQTSASGGMEGSAGAGGDDEWHPRDARGRFTAHQPHKPRPHHPRPGVDQEESDLQQEERDQKRMERDQKKRDAAKEKAQQIAAKIEGLPCDTIKGLLTNVGYPAISRADATARLLALMPELARYLLHMALYPRSYGPNSDLDGGLPAAPPWLVGSIRGSPNEWNPAGILTSIALLGASPAARALSAAAAALRGWGAARWAGVAAQFVRQAELADVSARAAYGDAWQVVKDGLAHFGVPIAGDTSLQGAEQLLVATARSRGLTVEQAFGGAGGYAQWLESRRRFSQLAEQAASLRSLAAEADRMVAGAAAMTDGQLLEAARRLGIGLAASGAVLSADQTSPLTSLTSLTRPGALPRALAHDIGVVRAMLAAYGTLASGPLGLDPADAADIERMVSDRLAAALRACP